MFGSRRRGGVAHLRRSLRTLLLLRSGWAAGSTPATCVERTAAGDPPRWARPCRFLGDKCASSAGRTAQHLEHRLPRGGSRRRSIADADAVLRGHSTAVGAGRAGSVSSRVAAPWRVRGRLVYRDERRDGLLTSPVPRLIRPAPQILEERPGTAVRRLRSPASATSKPRPMAPACRTSRVGRLQRLTRRRSGLAPQGSELCGSNSSHSPDKRPSTCPPWRSGRRRAAPLVLVVGMLGTKDASVFLAEFFGWRASSMALRHRAGRPPASRGDRGTCRAVRARRSSSGLGVEARRSPRSTTPASGNSRSES